MTALFENLSLLPALAAAACLLAALRILFKALPGKPWDSLLTYGKNHPVRTLFGILVAAILVILPLIYTWIDFSNSSANQELIKNKIDFVKTVATILGGGILLYGVYLTLRRIRALESQVKVAEDGQITDRYTKAVEQLGSDKMEVRLGGVYALERIARDSPRDYWTIMEVLTAYVRERAPWPPKKPPDEQTTTSVEPPTATANPDQDPPPSKPPTDIQAALTVLGRRARRYGQGEDQPLDLRGTDLRGADLQGAHLEGALLVSAHMERADFSWSHIEGVNLIGSHLENAYFYNSYMDNSLLLGAFLSNANFNRAFLKKADLCEAHMRWAILVKTNLEGADLSDANLEGADLKVANLDGAIFQGTHIEGADLRGAKGLTLIQLSQAFLDEHTQLPDDLQDLAPQPPAPGEPPSPPPATPDPSDSADS